MLQDEYTGKSEYTDISMKKIVSSFDLEKCHMTFKYGKNNQI